MNWHWPKTHPTDTQKTTQDMTVLPWPVSIYKVAQVATQLDAQASETELFSECQAAGWLSDWKDLHKVKSLIISRAGVNSSTSHVSCHSVLERGKKEKKNPHWFGASAKCRKQQMYLKLPGRTFFFSGQEPILVDKKEHEMLLVTSWKKIEGIR